MRSFFNRAALASFCGAVLMTAAPAEEPGVVRLKGRAPRGAIRQTSLNVYQTSSPSMVWNSGMVQTADGYCDCEQACPPCDDGIQCKPAEKGCRLGCHSCLRCLRKRFGNDDCPEDCPPGYRGCCCCNCLRTFMDNDLKHKLAKFGYFFPSGSGGEGTPQFGTYGIAYPRNPHYFDQRDGRLFSAQGYGVPMGVPLAPNVNYTYNYGWGIPSSRLTQISRVAPRNPYVGGMRRP